MNIKDIVRKYALWGSKEYMFGPVSVFFCDDTVSVNLTIPTGEGGRRPAWGFALQPFGVYLMGEDGDISWASPAFPVVDRIINKRG